MQFPIRLLIVEDRPEDAEILTYILQESGFRLECSLVDNESDYLVELDKMPDAIISDFSLPLFDGLSALKILKERKLDIPFIIVSGTIGEEIAVEAMKLGANDYIMKDKLSRLPLALERELKEKKNRQELTEVDQRYKNLVELSPDVILIHCQEKLVFLNFAGAAAFGVEEPQTLFGESIYKFIHPDFHQAYRDEIAQMEKGHLLSSLIDLVLVSPDGKELETEVIAVPIKYKEMPAIQVRARDTSIQRKISKKMKTQNTQLKKYIAKNKKLKYADLMKSKFIATMSHELRTPLNGIIGFSEVLKDGLLGPLNEKQREYCSDIYNSGQFLLELINDILDLSKVEAGKMELEIEPFDLKQLLEQSLTIIKTKAAQYHIDLELEIEDLINLCTYDPRKLKQIIYNLLSNAVKFAPNDSIVKVHAYLKNKYTLVIAVTDTGIGIAKEDLKRLFRPFEQIHSAAKTREKGTGLGLVIARHLAELHGGTVNVASIEGKGSTFTIELPYFPYKTQDETIFSKTTDTKSQHYALVVEDDPIAADLFGMQLKELGFEVLWKSTAEDVLTHQYTAVPDIIILDIFLPRMSGIELMAELKKHKILANVPTIVVSVAANENRGAIVGAVDILQKPIGRNQLTDSILNYVRKSNLKKNIHVLVVDDDRNSTALIEETLKEMPCKVSCIHDGAQALDFVNHHHPDVMILDLVMPKIDGFAVLEELKRHPETSDISIIILTSKSLTQEEQNLLKKHSANIFRKESFMREVFKREVKKVLLG
ncbi:MAG: hypothetical protein BGO43_08150 [Gammaproteobacteria bacterium 39-13]|nr:response regulator [Gammaproteobacteria bacterium]OJV91643.1 MAG: hypothetical protein BGO43_08150 [Gammaproteobacteria bacterium 39-13]